MISLAIGSAVYLVALQAGIDAPRAAFGTCLKQAAEKAKTDKMTPDAFTEFVKTSCAAQADSLKNALVKFDVKYGIKRAQATADAEVQIDDYLKSSASTYSAHNKPAVASK
jgi:hypothetical protein